jgi:hypothetical protein
MKRTVTIVVMASLGCTAPSWAPRLPAGPDSRWCDYYAHHACAPEDLWVIAVAVPRDVWTQVSDRSLGQYDGPFAQDFADLDPRSGIAAECDRGPIVSTSCGWYIADLQISEVIRGHLLQEPIEAVGPLSEQCALPEFASKPRLFLLSRRAEQYVISHEFPVLLDSDHKPAVSKELAFDVNAFGWMSYRASDGHGSLIPLELVRREAPTLDCN